MSSELKETIRKRINHPNFLSELFGMVAFNSNKKQEYLFEKITNSALIFRKILDEKKLIKKVNYNMKNFGILMEKMLCLRRWWCGSIKNWYCCSCRHKSWGLYS